MSNITQFPNYNANLSVLKVHSLSQEDMSVDDLFDGFDKLEVMTFSFDLGFIERIAKKFQTMTVILGWPTAVRGDAFDVVLASQGVALQEIRKHKALMQRALDGDVTFKMEKEVISHQKIYILTSVNGCSRVITGSANFSGRAFSGTQLEDFVCMEDDAEAMAYYHSKFDMLNAMCTVEVPLDSLYLSDTEEPDLKEIPICNEVLVKNASVIVEQPTYAPEEAEFVTDVSKLAKQYSKLTPRLDRRKKRIEIKPEHIREMIRMDNALKNEEAEKRKVYPHLHINYLEERAFFNGKEYDLQDINMNRVQQDLRVLQTYFDGFDSFIGDVNQAKRIYYKLMNFMLASPFMAMLRYVAHINGYAEEYFPYYAIICGKKSAGKTSFVQFIQYLMTGQRIEVSPCEVFTASRMNVSLQEIEGIPVCLDDMRKERFSNAGDIVKCDVALFNQKLQHHGTYIITTNDIDNIKPELAKRMYFASVAVTQTNTDAVAKKKRMTTLQNQLSTAVYSLYLQRMIPRVNEMITKMEAADTEVDQTWQPDIFALSSKTIMEIYRECQMQLPVPSELLVYEDYFGYNSISESARVQMQNEWQHNKGAFHVIRNQNLLEYTAGEYGYQAKYVVNSLPEVLEAKQFGPKVVMKLDAAEKFFGITFRKGLFNQ